MSERSSEVVKFSEIDFLPTNPTDRIGLNQIGDGVIDEIVAEFKVEDDVTTLDGLDSLIQKVCPEKELRGNIEHAKKMLGPNAIEIARDWVQRTGLLEAVERSFMRPELPLPDNFTLGVIIGGLANVIDRRTNAILPFAGEVEQVLMLGGRGRSGYAELTQSEYLSVYVRSKLLDAGFDPVVSKPVNSTSGNEVVNAGVNLVPESGAILVAGNAGNWLQIASQFRRAMRNTYPEFDTDGQRLFVVSDSIALGYTGSEPALTHQHPLSAIGAIVRNFKQVERSFINE
jgi:hypothetical protein